MEELKSMHSALLDKTPRLENQPLGCGKRRLIKLSALVVPPALSLIALSAMLVTPVAAATLGNEIAAAPIKATLTGIIHARRHPMALIEIDGKQHIYTVGDLLPGGLLIKDIEVDRVRLTGSDKSTTLYFGGMLAEKNPVEKNLAVKGSGTAGMRDAGQATAAVSERAQPGFSGEKLAAGSVSASWVIPEWLQRGRSGPVSMEDVKKSPWSKK